MAKKQASDNRLVGPSTIDLGVQVRRFNRKPLDDSSVFLSYNALLEDLTSGHSSIYRGQIVTVLDTNSSNDTTYLVKNDFDTNTSYYIDKILTWNSFSTYLEDGYVQKYQLGTTYTGVGQWYDCVVDKTKTSTSTYSEIFNDYINNNFITEGDMYGHIEGMNNTSQNSIAVHIEGGSNQINSGSYLHVEGFGNVVTGNASSVTGYGNVIENNLSYVSVEGESNKANFNAQGSHTEGTLNTTSGEYSHTEGKLNTSSGNVIHTEGIFNIVDIDTIGAHIEGSYNSINTGNYSHVEGLYNINTGHNTHIEGIYNTASGINSHVEGGSNKVYSAYSHSEGENNTIEKNSTNSHVEGKNNNASSELSHIEGVENSALFKNSHIEGYQNQSRSTYSHIEGIQNVSYNEISIHIEGKLNQGFAEYSHIEGTYNVAYGMSSHVEGMFSTTGGIGAHAENNSEADGTFSHAGGHQSSALGFASFVHGIYSSSVGQANIALGYGIIANGVEGQISLGKYNAVYTDAILQIGIGTSDTYRKNALLINKDGVSYFSNVTYVIDPGTGDLSPAVTYVSYTNLQKYVINQLSGEGTLGTYMKDIYDKFSSLKENIKSIDNVVPSNEYVDVTYTLQSPENVKFGYNMDWTNTHTLFRIPGATTVSAGVMTYTDKTRINSIYDGDSELSNISISSGTWTIYDANGNDVTNTIASSCVTKGDNYINIDTGYQVSWSGTWKWNNNNGSLKSPESTTGSWGTTLIPVNTNSNVYTNTIKYNVSSQNKTVAKQTITAAKKGLMVVGSKVVPADGVDTKETTVNCKFITLITAWGFSTSNTISVNDVLDKAFKAGNRLGSPKRITFNTAPSDTEYVFYVYPATNGDISAVVMNGADDVKNAWVKQGTVDVTFPVSNATIKYKVYVSTQPGAYKQSQYVDFTF